MVKVIVADKKIDSTHLIGKFLDESHYDTLITEDCDAYMPAGCDMSTQIECEKSCSDCDVGSDERRIIFKFRKNFFTKQQQDDAYEGLRGAARESQNRGMAAGPKGAKLQNREWVSDEHLDILQHMMYPEDNLFDSDPIEDIREHYRKMPMESARGMVWLANKVKTVGETLTGCYSGFEFNKWVDAVKKDKNQAQAESWIVMKEMISATTYANPVLSGIAGWFDRYPRIPYGRSTSYTRDYFDLFKKSFPFLQRLDQGFRELVPTRWGNQRKAADKLDPQFLVPKTVFTTITVNKNFRTAAHLDAGDFSDGLSNLLVVSNGGEYEGAYLVAPEYRIAIDVRPGDLLLINNHEVIHGNTPIVLKDPNAERISLVYYFSENMLDLGSKDYEDCRFNFVESRRLNQEHPLWRPLWNGVSAGMWENKEWYNYLEAHLGGDIVTKYHPEAHSVPSSLEDLF